MDNDSAPQCLCFHSSLCVVRYFVLINHEDNNETFMFYEALIKLRMLWTLLNLPLAKNQFKMHLSIKLGLISLTLQFGALQTVKV